MHLLRWINKYIACHVVIRWTLKDLVGGAEFNYGIKNGHMLLKSKQKSNYIKTKLGC